MQYSYFVIMKPDKVTAYPSRVQTILTQMNNSFLMANGKNMYNISGLTSINWNLEQ